VKCHNPLVSVQLNGTEPAYVFDRVERQGHLGVRGNMSPLQFAKVDTKQRVSVENDCSFKSECFEGQAYSASRTQGLIFHRPREAQPAVRIAEAVP